MVTEALDFLIHESGDPRDMMYLGGIYYELKEFDLARKYYEMAAACDHEPAHACLGYIFYYGRTGEPDYERAFYHFKKSADLGNLQSAYKVADMYRNGYYVEQDYDEYVSIIESLWPKVKRSQYTDGLIPEVGTRLAGIRAKQGRTEEAIALYLKAKRSLSGRLAWDAFFGNFTIMKGLIHDLYQLMPLDEDNIDFYDLYEVLTRPCHVSFYYKNKPHDIIAQEEDGAIVLSLDGRWYRNIDDFMQKGTVDGESLSARAGHFYYFEVEGR